MRDEYDRMWTADGISGKTRFRFGLTKEDGVPIRFVVQLEYCSGDEWLVVARFDHASDGPAYRRVNRVGLHLDVYHPDGTQMFKRTDFEPQLANKAMGTAEQYLRQHHERLVRRFELWM
jgi:hypothetical protein